MSSTLTELLVVVSADDMDREAFCKHMTFRHPESLGGLDELDPELLRRSGTEAMYRSFHAKLHELYPDLEHEHLPRESRGAAA